MNSHNFVRLLKNRVAQTFRNQKTSKLREQEIRDVLSQKFWVKCYEKVYLALQEARSWKKRT